MSQTTIPYIGSKISLISNSEIRYEGILYTINTQESTIALQSVHCFGTEGRKVPEIPPSSEVYDFIIFRGQDIKDLTVLEGSAQMNDPAILSVNQRPAGKGPAAASGKSASKGSSTGKATATKGGSVTGQEFLKKGAGGSAWGSPSTMGGRSGDYGGYGSSGKGSTGYGGGGGYGSSGYGSGSYGSGYYKDFGGSGYGSGKAGGSKGYESTKGSKASGKGKGDVKGKGDKGKSSGEGKSKGGKTSKGDGKGKITGKGEGKGKSTTKGKSGKSSGGAGSGGGRATEATPVGELLPEENAEVRKEFAEDFDMDKANDSFAKIADTEGATEEIDDTLKPLAGYDKQKSFFDSISCEATERAGEADRQKVDRDRARRFDRETFGDTRRPPRPTAGRRGKGARRGNGSKGGYRS